MCVCVCVRVGVCAELSLNTLKTVALTDLKFGLNLKSARPENVIGLHLFEIVLSGFQIQIEDHLGSLFRTVERNWTTSL